MTDEAEAMLTTASAATTAATSARPSLSVESPLVPLDSATDPAHCGRKAASLAELRAHGFAVPDGFVIPVGARPTRAQLESALGALGHGPVAVRSSGVAEDLPDASFAGHYLTVLEVRGVDAVLDAAARCVRSASSERLARYGRSGAPMAVLVQRMVEADAAGVAFSANPISGARDEVRISATRGLGDRLVDGTVDGDEWSVRAAGATSLAGSQRAIDAATAQRIAELARRIEALRGVPQDLEWAVTGTELFLLQARPITVLPVAPVFEQPKGSWQKDEAHFPEPITPFGASTNLSFEGVKVMRGMIETWGLLPDDLQARVIGHEFYLHMEPDDGGAAPPPWWVLGLVARLLPSLRKKLARAQQAIDSGLLDSVPEEWTSEIKPALVHKLRALCALDVTQLDDAALCAHLAELRTLCVDCMGLHFKLFVPQLVGVRELALVCKEALGWDTPQALRLLQGLSVASSAPTRELLEIAHFARDRPAARALIEARSDDLLQSLSEADPELAARLHAYLASWGVRTFGSDAGTPNLAEQPGVIAELLADLLERDALPDLRAAREALVAEARAKLADPEVRRRFDAALSYAERVYPLREDNVLLTDQIPTGLFRRAGLELGRRLVQRGVLAQADDMALLRADALTAALLAPTAADAQAAKRLQDQVRQHRAELAWVRANPGPRYYGPPPAPMPDLRGLPEAARRINGAMLWEFEQELAPPAASEGDQLGGTAGSAGVYRGRVRVVRSTADLAKLRTGEVLVCPTTSSAWMIVFQRAGALVTDCGSTLSHTAIVAREHGLPAVVGTGRATGVLKDGDEVIVDGNRGTVTRCGRA
jgi:phosphohistidine swiveling domain-containing protein